MERKHLAMLAALLLGVTLAGCGSTASPDGASAGPLTSLSDLAFSASAASADVTAPSAPSNLVWTHDGMTVTLSWGASTDDVGVVDYQLFYGNFYLGAFSDPALTLIGFKAATPYTFSVKARDAAGNVSVASNQVTVLLGSTQDTTPPTAPTSLKAVTVADTSVRLGWSASSDDVGVVVYQVYSGTTVVGTVPAGTSATVSSLTPGATYSFTVTARDAAGNVSPPSAALSVTTIGGTTCASAPPAPTVTVKANTSSAMTVSWNAVTPPSNCSVTYNVYRSTTSGFAPSIANQIASGLTTTWIANAALTPKTTYYFVVQAVDTAGSADSAQADASTPAYAALKAQYSIDPRAASASGLTPLLRIANTGSAAVALSTLTLRYWYTEDGTVDQLYACDYWATGCSNVTSKFVKMKTPTATADGYLELGFTSGAGSVAAGASTPDIQNRIAKSDYSTFDQTNDWSYDPTKLGPSDWSHVTLYQNGTLIWGLEPGTDTTPPSAPANLVAASTNSVAITLSWSPSTDDTGVVGYDVYKGSTVDGTTTGTVYKAASLASSTTYGFTVKARDAYGNVSSPSATLSATTAGPDSTPPSVPTGLQAASVTSGSASLTWNPSTDDVDVASYDVFVGTALAVSSAVTSDTVIGLSPSTTYSFTVRARDAAGNASGASAALAVSTPAAGGGSYALDPPDPCYAQYVVSGCKEGVASSTCGGNCRVANACQPPEAAEKGNLPMTFACPRFMQYSDEMVQAAKDDWGEPAPFVYGVVGHDEDTGGIDVGTSTCCQCYQLVFESGEMAISKTEPVAIPKPMIVQSFNTAAGGPKNFDIFMGGGGFGAFNACVPGTYAGAQTTNFGHFMYTAFPSQFSTDGGIKAVNLDECKVISTVTATSLGSPSCQDRVGQLCSNTAAASSKVANETVSSCIQTNLPGSFYHQNWHVRAKRIECPAALTRVTGCQLAPQGLPKADPKAQTVATADSSFGTGYSTTTMQDCCKPSCAWSNQVAGDGLTPVGKWGAFYSCDQNGVPITAP